MEAQQDRNEPVRGMALRSSSISNPEPTEADVQQAGEEKAFRDAYQRVEIDEAD
jgi:hypothetical protein